jgi:hypothetical protein
MTLDEKEEFNSLMWKRVANVAIGASTARKMGPKGTISKARLFLEEKDNVQSLIDAEDVESFKRALDTTTEALRRSLPRKRIDQPTGQRWGSSRKFLNIFLRDCFYNYALRKKFKLAKWGQWLEIPLDSHVAKGIKADSTEDQALPKWGTVIGLREKDNELYQCAAAKIAKIKYKTRRIHLDLVYFRQTNQ